MELDFRIVAWIFADGFGTVITLVVVLISLIGWLINLVNEKARQKPNQVAAPGDGPRGGEGRFQQEIDQFLQQVGGRPKQVQAVPAEEDIEIEVVPEDELQQRRDEERRAHKLSELEDRHVETSRLGEGIRPHLETSMDHESLDDKTRVEDYLEDDFGELKGDVVSYEPPPRRGLNPADIRAMLRDPDGIRKAIIVNEILTRRSLR